MGHFKARPGEKRIKPKHSKYFYNRKHFRKEQWTKGLGHNHTNKLFNFKPKHYL